jgi:hypothetical protein
MVRMKAKSKLASIVGHGLALSALSLMATPALAKAWAAKKPAVAAKVATAKATNAAPVATPVVAERDCAYNALSPQARAGVASNFLAQLDKKGADPAFENADADAVSSCAKRFGWNEARTVLVSDYTRGRIFRDDFIPKLTKVGIDTATVDQVMNFGPGKTSIISNVPHDQQWPKIESALKSAGLNLDSFAEADAVLLISYVFVSWKYWDALAALS